MPFDGNPARYSQPLTGLQRRRILIDALRADYAWPGGFSWDYAHLLAENPYSCRSNGCALGLAATIGLIDGAVLGIGLRVGGIAALFDMTSRQVIDIFYSMGTDLPVPLPADKITPAMVADALEALGDSA